MITGNISGHLGPTFRGVGKLQLTFLRKAKKPAFCCAKSLLLHFEDPVGRAFGKSSLRVNFRPKYLARFLEIRLILDPVCLSGFREQIKAITQDLAANIFIPSSAASIEDQLGCRVLCAQLPFTSQQGLTSSVALIAVRELCFTSGPRANRRMMKPFPQVMKEVIY